MFPADHPNVVVENLPQSLKRSMNFEIKLKAVQKKKVAVLISGSGEKAPAALKQCRSSALSALNFNSYRARMTFVSLNVQLKSRNQSSVPDWFEPPGRFSLLDRPRHLKCCVRLWIATCSIGRHSFSGNVDRSVVNEIRNDSFWPH